MNIIPNVVGRPSEIVSKEKPNKDNNKTVSLFTRFLNFLYHEAKYAMENPDQMGGVYVDVDEEGERAEPYENLMLITYQPPEQREEDKKDNESTEKKSDKKIPENSELSVIKKNISTSCEKSAFFMTPFITPKVAGKISNILGKVLGCVAPNLLLPGYDSPPNATQHNYFKIATLVNSIYNKSFLEFAGDVLLGGGNEIHQGFRWTVQQTGSLIPNGAGTVFNLAKISRYVPTLYIPNIIQRFTAIPVPFLVSIVRSGTDMLPPWTSQAVWFFNTVNYTYIKNSNGDVSGSISGSINTMRENIKKAHGDELLVLVDNLVSFISEYIDVELEKKTKHKEINWDERVSYKRAISDSFNDGFVSQMAKSSGTIAKSAIHVTLYAFIYQFFIEGQQEAQMHNKAYERFKQIISSLSNKISYGQTIKESTEFKLEMENLFKEFEKDGGNNDVLIQIRQKYHLLVKDYVSKHGGWGSDSVKSNIFEPYFERSTLNFLKSIVGMNSGLSFAEEKNLYLDSLKIPNDEEKKKQLKQCFLKMSDKFMSNSMIVHQYEQAFIQILVKIGRIIKQLSDYEQKNIHQSGTSTKHTQLKETKEKYQKELYAIVKKSQRELVPIKIPDWILQAGLSFGGFGFDILFGNVKIDEKTATDMKANFEKIWEFRAFDSLIEVNNLLDEWKVKDSVHNLTNKIVAEVVKLVFKSTSLIDLIDLVLPQVESFLGGVLPTTKGERLNVSPFKLSMNSLQMNSFLTTKEPDAEALKIKNVRHLNFKVGEFTDLFIFERDGKMYKAWAKTEDLENFQKEKEPLELNEIEFEFSVTEVKPFKIGTTAEALKKIFKGEVSSEKLVQFNDILLTLLTNIALAQLGRDWGDNIPVSPKEILKAVAPFLGGWGKLIDEAKNVHSHLETKTGSQKLTNKIKGVFDHIVKVGKDIFNEEIDEEIDKGLEKLNGKNEVEKKDPEIGEIIENGNKKVLIGKVFDQAVGTVTGVVDHTIGFFFNRILDIAPQLGSKLTINGQERMGDPKFLKKASAEVMRNINKVLDLHANNPNADDLKPLTQKEFIKKAIEAILRPLYPNGRPLYPNGVTDMPYPDELIGNAEEIKKHQEKAWDHIVRQAEVHVNWLIHTKGPLKLNLYEFIGKDHIEKVAREQLGCEDKSLTIAETLKNKIWAKLTSWTGILETPCKKIASIWKAFQDKKDKLFDFNYGKQFNGFLDQLFGFIFFTLPKYTVGLGADVLFRSSIDHLAENIDSIATSGLPEKVLQVAVLSALSQLSSFENGEYKFRNISDAQADTMYKSERRKLESNVINTVLKGTPLNIVVKVAARIVDIVAAVLISVVAFVAYTPFVRRRLINLASYFIQDKGKEENKLVEVPKEEEKKPSSLYDKATVPLVHFFKWIKGEEIVVPQKKNIIIKGVEAFFKVEGDTALEWTMDLLDRAIPVGAEELKKTVLEKRKKEKEEKAKKK